MKTILVLTDFSINADYMADYALALAQHAEANLLLCNVFERPANESVPDAETWARQACEENSIEDLGALMARLKTKLDKEPTGHAYRPEIEQCSVAGKVGGQLTDILLKHQVIFAIVSAHGRDNYIGFLNVDHTWAIIDHAGFPVLVIPYQVRYKAFHEIVLANPVTEIAEETRIKKFFEVLPFRINYHYLKQVTQPVKMDLLVIVHHQRNFFQRLFKGSLTRKLATQSNTPLLVFPGTHLTEPANLF